MFSSNRRRGDEVLPKKGTFKTLKIREKMQWRCIKQQRPFMESSDNEIDYKTRSVPGSVRIEINEYLIKLHVWFSEIN